MNTTTANWLYLVYPVVGILIVTILLRYVVKENISHGVTKVLYAISRRKSRLRKGTCTPHCLHLPSPLGSVDLSGPVLIVLAGAAIGSNVGQAFRMSPRILMILVGCGAAAGIAGIFPCSYSRNAIYP